MAEEQDPFEELIDLAPDPRLLAEDLPAVPAALGQPAVIPPSRLRSRPVAAGAAMTGLTLTIGVLLLVLGAVLLVAGSSGAAALSALVAGAVLIGTHWGWVHVAEIGSQRLEVRGHRDLVAGRERWLAEIEPYTRYAVSTRVNAGGSVEIVTTRHQPRRASRSTFTFERREMASERHGPEEPAAAVTERAEQLRHRAADATERERERYLELAGARQLDRLREADDDERVAADRAAAQALSEQINSHLRSPPGQ